MIENKCPMCGNTNEPGAEVCEYCQARIKPLVIRSSTPKESKPDSSILLQSNLDGKQEVISWLEDLKNSSTSDLHEADNLPSPDGKRSFQHVGDTSDQDNSTDDDLSQNLKESNLIIETKYSSQKDGEVIGVPDWLVSLRKENYQSNEGSENQSENGLSENTHRDEEVPDWLQLNREQTKQDEKTEKKQTLKKDEFLIPKIPPEGLMQIQSTPSMNEPISVEESLIKNLQDANQQPGEVNNTFNSFHDHQKNVEGQLPDWLKIMQQKQERTSETATNNPVHHPQKPDQPLLEIAGVLNAEEKVYPTHKPGQYSMKLQATEKELELARLVDEMYRNDEIPPPKRSKIKNPLFVWIRLVICILLILGSIIPSLQKHEISGIAGFYPEVSELYNIIDQIGYRDPVVVAVDYSPGYSGELDLGCVSIFDHLMKKGAFILIVSSIPTGSVQGEHLIQLANKYGIHSYQPGIDYVNLGFIPGGMTGISQFINNPRLFLPYSADGIVAWTIDPISSISQLSDFKLVLVATDGLDITRIWIEQTRDYLNSSHLGFVVSAQVEPMLRPYYNSIPRQITGFLSGIEDGKNYQELLYRGQTTSEIWQGYQASIIISIILIIVVSFLFAIYSYRSDERSLLSMEH